VIEVLECVLPPAELRILLEGPIEERVPTVLARLILHGHELGLDGPQDIESTLVHIPLGVLGTPVTR
jgi:hypothetical protein